MRGSTSSAAIRAGLIGSLAVSLQCVSAQPALADTNGPTILQNTYLYPFAAGVLAGCVLTGTVCGIAVSVMKRRQEKFREEKNGSTSVLHAEDFKKAHAETRSQDTGAFDPDATRVVNRHPHPQEGEVASQEDWDAWGHHLSNDLEDVASNYVERLTFAERVASKARGVREDLGERLGVEKDAFDGLPIIERADGTVGDVGTSWWNNRLGDSIRTVNENTQSTGKILGVDELAPGAPRERAVARPQAKPQAQSRKAAPAMSVPAAPSKPASAVPIPAKPRQRKVADVLAHGHTESIPDWMSNSARAKVDLSDFRGMSSTSRSALIASRVAEVDQGVFPAKRDVRELDHDDMWDEALASMDERINAYIAKPGLVTAEEAKAESIRQAQLDVESHVDQLVNEEFARRHRVNRPTNSLDASDSWRVLDGTLSPDATNVLNGRRRTRKAPAYKPKHMAHARVAQGA